MYVITLSCPNFSSDLTNPSLRVISCKVNRYCISFTIPLGYLCFSSAARNNSVWLIMICIYKCLESLILESSIRISSHKAPICELVFCRSFIHRSIFCEFRYPIDYPSSLSCWELFIYLYHREAFHVGSDRAVGGSLNLFPSGIKKSLCSWYVPWCKKMLVKLFPVKVSYLSRYNFGKYPMVSTFEWVIFYS